MIVYDGVKSDFLSSVVNDTIAMEIEQNILNKMGRHTVSNEFVSWDNSMQYMYKVMNDPEIPDDAGVAIEYNIPIASMIAGNQEFVMIDEQKVVYEEILKISGKCQRDHRKRTVICTGGPGTGKSVIAVQLLAELTRRDQFVQYVSKNQAPRQVYLQKLKGKKKLTGVENLFKGSACYTNVGRSQIHTLIVDEAHRLEERSQYTKKRCIKRIRRKLSGGRTRS